jgi:hypothetical protein
MAKNNKGMVCLIHPWEFEAAMGGQRFNCRNHRHLSRRRVFERTSDARFADRTLVKIFDRNFEYIGSIVEVAGQARWAMSHGEDLDLRPAILPAGCRSFVEKYLQYIQSLLHSKKPIPRAIQVDWESIKVSRPPRAAAICEALRSYSPSSLTSRDAELAVEAKTKKG